MPKKAEQKISDVQGKALDQLYRMQQRAKKRKDPVRGYGLSARDKAGRRWETERLGPAMFKKGLVTGCTADGEYDPDFTWYYRLTEKGEALAKARAEERGDAKAAHMERCAEYDESHKTYFVTVRVSVDLEVAVAAKNIQDAQEKILTGKREDCCRNGFGKVRAVALLPEEHDCKREVVAIREVPHVAPHRLSGELRGKHGVNTPSYNEYEEGGE